VQINGDKNLFQIWASSICVYQIITPCCEGRWWYNNHQGL
jgi:hypothetical protein